MSEPSQGSSPEPSAMRPQRASRHISTIGLNVQFTPSALASIAEMRAMRSMAAGFQEHESAIGMGNIVS